MSSVWNVRPTHKNRDFKVVCNKCDICDGRISCSDNVETEIDMLDGIDNSYESEYDKHEPRLLLCDSCKKRISNSWVSGPLTSRSHEMFVIPFQNNFV